MGALRGPALARLLTEAGYSVKPLLAPGAERFVGPAAFAAAGVPLSGPPEDPDAVAFAPAGPDVLSRLAWGVADAPTFEKALSGRRGCVVALEMDAGTLAHPAVRRNIRRVRESGCRVLEPEGGRMAPPGGIAAALFRSLGGELAGRRIVVTAGGTREPLDAVRFIGNRSSGKMGLAVAREALARGADVSVVAANLGTPEPGVEWIPVETVAEMERAVLEAVARADALIMAAAVSDFTPTAPGRGKVRRREGLKVEFRSTPDILARVRESFPHLFMIGFAAAFGDPLPDAREKLERKGADIIVGNDISRPEIGFGSDENEVCIVSRGEERRVGRASKREIARVILDVLISELNRKGQT
jgi:phosphopantothenoylcysteine decarboxylase/phosphopantothenate--cysteine ligase